MNAELPEGILPFLFTDIEGSTPLWEKDPDGMRQALALHNDALYGAIEVHGGQVFKVIGDEFQAVFREPLQAVRAAVTAQRALAHTNWGRVGPLRVRMGIHTGQAQVEGRDYAVSHTFNRAARLMSAGHGGQILLSQETAALVRSQLPAEISLRDMGRQRLKGLSQEEHIFQVVAAGLPAEFPPLNVRDAVRHNLPAQVTPFIGRQQELEEIQSQLAPRRAKGRAVPLLTLTGPGGMGKTRLALEAAERMVPDFADGVFFVDLSAVSDADFVLPAIERALSLRENLGQSTHENLVEFLSDRQLLLVLDNFEQVLPAANAVAALLSAVRGLQLLVTSRSLLHVYGEVSYEVKALPCPDRRQLPPLEQLLRFESIQLFNEQAQAVRTSFTVDEKNVGAVAEICRRLDGLPLAIELAAARVRLLSLQQILIQLENCFRLLSGGARNLPPRQRTLQGAIDWSYDLLDQQEQALFRRLGIFARSCSLAAAIEVCDFSGEMDVFTGLEALIDHSLLSLSDMGEEPRFVMLQTIHDYALSKLTNSGEAAEARRRHLAFYTEFAVEAQQFVESAEQSLWLDRLEEEYDNLSAALRLAIAEEDSANGLRLAQALRVFWFSRGYLLEGRRFLSQLLALPMAAPERAQLLDSAGFLARYGGDYVAAEVYIGEGLAIARQLDDTHTVANYLANAGFVYLQQNQFEQARAVYSEALELYERLANEQGQADATIHLGLIAFYEGDVEQAKQCYGQSLAAWQRLGDKQGVVYAQQMLGDAALQQGDLGRADQLYGDALHGAGAIGFKLVIATALEGFALIAAARGKPQPAWQLAGAAAALRKQANVPASAARRQFMDHALRPANEALGVDGRQAAYAAGQQLTVDEAAAMVRGMLHQA